MKSPALLENPGRFEMRIDQSTVAADFSRGPNRIIIERLVVDDELRGGDAVDRFMRALVDHAVEKRLNLEARDETVARWLDDRPEHHHLRVERQEAQDGTQGELETLSREGDVA